MGKRNSFQMVEMELKELEKKTQRDEGDDDDDEDEDEDDDDDDGDQKKKKKNKKKKRQSLLSTTTTTVAVATGPTLAAKTTSQVADTNGIDLAAIDLEFDIDRDVNSKLCSKKLLPSMFAWFVLISASSAYFICV